VSLVTLCYILIQHEYLNGVMLELSLSTDVSELRSFMSVNSYITYL